MTQNDYLQYQLYLSSTSSRLKKQRNRSWLSKSIGYIILSSLFYISGQNHYAQALTYYFFVAGLLFLFFYPTYKKYYLKKYFTQFTNDRYRGRSFEDTTTYFHNDYIEIKDKTVEYKINVTELENTIETPDYFYMTMKIGGHLIIPKLQLSNIKKERLGLKNLSAKLQVPFTTDLKWRWY